MKKSDLFFNVIRLPVDFLMLLVAGVATYILRTKIISVFRPALFEFNLPLIQYLYLVIFVAVLFVLAYGISGLYSMRVKMGRAEEFFKIIVASSAGIMLVIIFIFLRQELFNSRFLVLGGWFFAILFVSIGRLAIRAFQNILVGSYDFGIHKVMIIGKDEAAGIIGSEIRSNPAFGFRIIKETVEPKISEIRDAMAMGLDEVILADPDYPSDKIIELVDFCQENHIIFKFVPNLFQTLTTNFNIDVISRYPLIELKRTPMDGWGRVAKRTIDIIISVLGMIILSPVLAAIAFAIKWETEGPVFVHLKRISKNREFYLIKFRSMIACDKDGSADSLKEMLRQFNERKDSPLFKMKNDPRLTKVGRLIRKFRLDEFPQFWNILRGDISLVGPRPHQPDEVAHYEKKHRKVLAIKAGATGLAQVSGSSDLPFDQEVALDSFYIENWSLLLDIKIILRTMAKMLKDKSAA